MSSYAPKTQPRDLSLCQKPRSPSILLWSDFPAADEVNACFSHWCISLTITRVCHLLHDTPVFKWLHWLPTNILIECNILLLTYECRRRSVRDIFFPVVSFTVKARWPFAAPITAPDKAKQERSRARIFRNPAAKTQEPFFQRALASRLYGCFIFRH